MSATDVTTPEVLRLGDESVDEVVDVFCDAFRDYPVMREVLRERNAGYEAALRTLVRFFVMARVLRREILLGVGEPAALLAVATVSRPQGPPAPPALGELRERVWQELGSEARARYAGFSAAWAPFQIDVPHLHLNMIGVRRAAQGRGLARALLEQVHRLSADDPDSAGVSLTTEDPANVSLYEYFGYRIVGEAQLTPTIRTWGLYRPDRSASARTTQEPEQRTMADYFEPDPGAPLDPSEILTGCVESGSRAVLLDEDGLPSEFFDLSSRVAGELLHKLSTYRLRLAAVVPDPAVHSSAFQDFAREANRGLQFRFFSTRAEAIRWLQDL